MARLATALVTLRNQINAMAPQRSKVSDGWIGDTAHGSRKSRHNPNARGVVTALDITDDPRHGVPIHQIADRVRRNPHPQLAYIISNGRIAGRSTGWKWRVYTGANKHVRHVHFAVGNGTDGNPSPPYDSTTAWTIATSGTSQPTPAETTPKDWFDMATEAELERVVERVLRNVIPDYPAWVIVISDKATTGPVYFTNFAVKVELPRGEGHSHEYIKGLRALSGQPVRAVPVPQSVLDDIPTITE